jgi:hypothetical protein
VLASSLASGFVALRGLPNVSAKLIVATFKVNDLGRSFIGCSGIALHMRGGGEAVTG